MKTLADRRPEDWKFQPQTLEGRRVLVTGGTTGIGRATVMLCAHLGAKVAYFGQTREHLDDMRSELDRFTLKAHGFQADNADVEGLRRVFDEADEALGGLDALVNNAGIAADSIEDHSIEEAHRVLEVNLLGYIACAKLAVERMQSDALESIAQIVNIGSMSAEKAGPGSDVYVATKSAIRGFSKSLSKQLSSSGIRVTLIEPALTGSDFFEGEKGQPGKQRELQSENRMMTAEDIAESIAFCLMQPVRVNVVMMQVAQSGVGGEEDE